MAMEEHYGSNVYNMRLQNLSSRDNESTQYRIRTAPLWGVRLRPRLMHDGQTLTLLEAIRATKVKRAMSLLASRSCPRRTGRLSSSSCDRSDVEKCLGN
jgi:hypothetical protein